MTFVRATLLAALVSATALLSACGGGSTTHNSSQASGNNVQPIVVNSGPDHNYANGVFTTVMVCAPGSSNCTNVSGVLVDTGSFGLRILSSALGSVASSLPQQNAASGNPVVECAQFVSSVLWGPVKTADVAMAGEKATSVPIQVVDTSVPVPAGCKAQGPAEESLSSLGANGILGVGFFISDCGPACASPGTGNPGFYYGCAGSSCQVIGQSESQQVQNPVALFKQNNNGVVIQLPMASGSEASLSGSMIFGIGTQTNNAIGSAQIFRPDNNGNLKTNFKGTTFEGFLDSGSNAYFFLTSSGVGMPDCPSPETGFYCPSSPVSLSATNTSGSGSGASSTINFTIGNADQLFQGSANAAFPTLGGPNPSTFDWGLPFFFGRHVFVAYQSPAGNGPYWAY